MRRREPGRAAGEERERGGGGERGASPSSSSSCCCCSPPRARHQLGAEAARSVDGARRGMQPGSRFAEAAACRSRTSKQPSLSLSLSTRPRPAAWLWLSVRRGALVQRERKVIGAARKRTSSDSTCAKKEGEDRRGEEWRGRRGGERAEGRTRCLKPKAPRSRDTQAPLLHLINARLASPASLEH